MFEVFSCDPQDPKRFRLELAASPGGDSRQLPFPDSSSPFALPIRKLVTLNTSLNLQQVHRLFSHMESLYQDQPVA